MCLTEFDRLVDIMARLRSEGGCPWDREQTHFSLRQYLLEEAYEVLDSIDTQNYEELKLELGDLLLQIVFQARIAEEEGRFDIREVVRAITAKLIRRHPHVFGEAEINTSQEQLRNWEKLKLEEGKSSILDGVPRELPALLRAYRIQDKASHVGFDWENIDQVWAKVEEEITEFKEAIQLENPEKIQEEFGDLLFALVNLSRFLEINPEDCLRATISKFVKRFQMIERQLKARGKSLESSTLQEMDEIWNESKHLEKKS